MILFELARRSWKLRSRTWRAMRGRRWTAGGAAYGRRGPFTGDCAELDTRRCQVRHARAPLQGGETRLGTARPETIARLPYQGFSLLTANREVLRHRR